MPSYNRLIASVCIFCNLNLFAIEKSDITNDLFTVVGLDRELNNDFAQSGIIFEKMYEKTKSSEYLQKAVDSYFRDQDFQKVFDLTNENLKQHKDIEEYLLTQTILSLMVLKRYEDALPYAKELEIKYSSSTAYGLIGDLYYILGNFGEARKNYEVAYKELKTPNLVLALTNVLYFKLNEKEKGLKYLQDFVDEFGCVDDSCAKLIDYYEKDNNLVGMTKAIEVVYREHKKNKSSDKLAKLELLLGELYMQVDSKKAIDFLKQTGNNNLNLATMYEVTRDFQKALELFTKEYELTKDKSILGKIAMMKYTLAKDKKTVLDEVMKNFELALEEKSNPEFENFYGYILIDFDLDIKKGLKLVKKAHEVKPEDIATLDSLAWGYFKNRECTLAYEYITKVVNKVGLNDEEVKLHYEAIKECYDTKK